MARSTSAMCQTAVLTGTRRPLLSRRQPYIILCCFIALQLISSNALAQLPAGSTATITYSTPVTRTVTDPNTGITSSETTKETILDIKHEDMVHVSTCTGELVVINGHARFTISTTEAGDGSTTETMHQESAGTGVGFTIDDLTATGSRYAYNMTSQSKSRLSSTLEPQDQMLVAHENLIRQGEVETATAGDDHWMRTNLHITFVDGQPVPRVDKFEFGCR